MAAATKQTPVTIQALLISGLAQTDALAKLLIDKGIITQQEFLAKISRRASDLSAHVKANVTLTFRDGRGSAGALPANRRWEPAITDCSAVPGRTTAYSGSRHEQERHQRKNASKAFQRHPGTGQKIPQIYSL
jgi:hypothetical protein